jgi:DNA-binding response OmpR family regulator
MLAAAIVAGCGPKHIQRADATLLLVEDDQATAAAMRLLVEARGYAVRHARNGTEALAALASADFDAIILDLILPEVDGFIVLERLRSTWPHLLRRVIVTTGVPDRYAGGFALSGICGVMRKPIDVSELERLLAGCTTEHVFEAGGEYPPV